VRAAIRGDGIDSTEVLFWAWTAAVVFFFSLSPFKLDHDVFPAAPTLCLLCARAYLDLRDDRLSPRHTGVRVGMHMVGPMLVAIGVGCGYFLVERLDLPKSAAVVPVALTLAGAALTALVNIRGGHPPKVPWVVMLAMLVTYAGLVGFVIPALEQKKVVDDITADMTSRAEPDSRFATYKMDRWNPTFRFYSGRHVTFLEDPVQAREFFASGGPFYCVMRKAAFDEFAAQGVPLQAVAERDGMWATSGRALWRSRIPTTRFLLVTRAK
jgi:hypothetical protein